MAVLARRPLVALWAAWVAAAAIGTTIGGLMLQAAPDLFSHDVLGALLALMLAAAPLFLLQFVALRALAGVSPVDAGIWFGFSLLGVAANLAATNLWFEGFMNGPANWLFGHSPSWMAPHILDALMGVDGFIYPLVIGLMQGVVLSRISKRWYAAPIWMAANVLAVVAATWVTDVALNAWLPVSVGAGPNALYGAVFWAVYAAVTGSALVFILRFWWPVMAPAHAPAAR